MISLEYLCELIEQFRLKFNNEYVYKACLSRYIVVMEKLADTITNESRKGINNEVINTDTAKFRADKLRVVLIIDLKDGTTTTTTITNRFIHNPSYFMNTLPYIFTTEYEVGSIALPNHFERDLDIVCGGGIHYFRTVEPAFFYNRYTHKSFTGVWKKWTCDGMLFKQQTYIDGLRNGQSESWYMNGQPKIRCNYIDGVKSDPVEEWHSDGTQKFNQCLNAGA